MSSVEHHDTEQRGPVEGDAADRKALPPTTCEQPHDANGGTGACTAPALARLTYTDGREESVCYLHLLGIQRHAPEWIAGQRSHIIGTPGRAVRGRVVSALPVEGDVA